MTAPDPNKLDELGQRLDEFQTRQTGGPKRTPPNQSGIAIRFATELFAGVVGGGGIGWGIDWLFGHFGFHTLPTFTLVCFVLGIAAGIRNVMRAANEINAEIANQRSDKENGS